MDVREKVSAVLGAIGVAGVVLGIAYVVHYASATIKPTSPKISSITIAAKDVLQLEGTIMDAARIRALKEAIEKKVKKNDVLEKEDIKALRRRYADMPGLHREIIKRVKRGDSNILIRINSGGGQVTTGMRLVHLMHAAQRQGVKFTCVVDTRAASMALVIFSECDSRFATFGSSILWHSAATYTNEKMNEFTIAKLQKEILKLNRALWVKTKKYFSNAYWTKHFKASDWIDVSEIESKNDEFLHVIRNLKVTGIVVKPKIIKKKGKVNGKIKIKR